MVFENGGCRLLEKVTDFLKGQVCTAWLKKEVYALLKEEWIKY